MLQAARRLVVSRLAVSSAAECAQQPLDVPCRMFSSARAALAVGRWDQIAELFQLPDQGTRAILLSTLLLAKTVWLLQMCLHDDLVVCEQCCIWQMHMLILHRWLRAWHPVRSSARWRSPHMMDLWIPSADLLLGPQCWTVYLLWKCQWVSRLATKRCWQVCHCSSTSYRCWVAVLTTS